MNNILSFDIESWVHLSDGILPPSIPRRSEEKKKFDADYLPRAIDHLLRILSESNNSATFFILGEVFEWYPESIRNILREGHEIAYHGHDHNLIINSKILKDQLDRSQEFMETFRPKGFRAPQLYLRPEETTALHQAGFRYSSSSYGPFTDKNIINGITEIPISTYPWQKIDIPPPGLPRDLRASMILKEIPFGSGIGAVILGSKTGYYINKLNSRSIPSVLMLHPWQLMVPPEISKLSFRMKVLLSSPFYLPYTLRREKCLSQLINQHNFTSFSQHLGYDQS
jgi:peptidoglycan/xylan/chitin deacetylase (PgdA/CDA1 family)